jgi:hypothetical protein
MNKNLTYLLFLGLSIFFSSCLSTFRGDIQQSGFSINDCDFKIVNTAEGIAKATYVFGIGGNLREGLVNDAKRNLYNSTKLTKNQQLTNITTDIKTSTFIIPIVTVQTAIITADIIEFFPRNNFNEKTDLVQSIPAPVQEPEKVLVEEKFTDKMLTAMKISKDLKVSQYNSIGEVAKGDYVKVSINISGYKQTLIGRVEGFAKKNNILIEIEPSPGVFMQEEHPFNYCEKIISW